MKFKIRGFVAWWVWRSYYLMQMVGWSRRIRIVLDWTTALFFKNDIVQLDLFGDKHPLERHANCRCKNCVENRGAGGGGRLALS